MNIRLTFFGAAQNVTGSKTLLEFEDKKFVIDYGLYQERAFKSRNWDPFPVLAHEIDGILLTHAHLDHCGLLPRLVLAGYSGPIYTTTASAEIAKIVLLDSAHMHEEDAAYKAKRHRREGRRSPYPIIPLYTTEQAEKVLPLFEPVPYAEPVKVAEGVEVVYHDAGHILGAAMVEVRLSKGGESRTLIFSGDIGRADRPILRDPSFFEQADYVIMESTYGDRVHPEEEDVETLLAQAVNSTLKAGGNLLIPVFAVERSQEVLYHLSELQRAKRIPKLMTFLDSPMAVRVTKVFREHPEMVDEEMKKLIAMGHSPFDTPGLKLVRTVETSKSINHIRGTAIVLAGSGMCTGGRIKHHLVRNIHRPESMVLFVGYQAPGTLGRLIVDGKEEVRILGRQHHVRCGIKRIHGFSAHADRDEMVEWVTHLKSPPRQVFINHGEENAAKKFGSFLQEKTGWKVTVPEATDCITLE